MTTAVAGRRRRPAAPALPASPDLEALLPSWLTSLRAENKSPATLKSYGDGVRRFLTWCAATSTAPVLERRSVRAFTDDLLAEGAEPSTARSRQLALRRFSAWLVEEGEAQADDLLGLRSPKLDVKVVQPLTVEELQAMLKACEGRELRERRDAALLRLMLETGVRASEAVNLQVADVDVTAGVAVITRGKGGRGRSVSFGPKTAQAIDRYLRTRRTHRLADGPALWLGDRGKEFSYDALHKTLRERAAAAGVDGFHPHRLRHTFASRWLEAKGSESGLMAVAGWARPDMLLRYTRARASERAAAEAQHLNLGDV